MATGNYYENFIDNIKTFANNGTGLVIAGDRYDDIFYRPDAPNAVKLMDILQSIFTKIDDSTVDLYLEISSLHGEANKIKAPESFIVPNCNNVGSLIEEIVKINDSNLETMLIIDADYMFKNPDRISASEEDFKLAKNLELIVKNHTNIKVIILTSNSRKIPNEIIKHYNQMQISMAGIDERHNYGAFRLARILKNSDTSADEIQKLATSLAKVSDGWKLQKLEKYIQFCKKRECINNNQSIESLSRSFNFGINRSPWESEQLYETIQKADGIISNRVKGQDSAKKKVILALKKATVGLSRAHQGELNKGPRAIFFFAGPTGTGKTELAKAIAQLIFGDESSLIRFDMSEFRQEHTVARLIGAPPGYAGYGTGGELTEKIKAKPHSVVLFDEIEKASPRILDIFLSILDDGRLTDGQGNTTFFNESIIIFTSNLGIYEEITNSMGIVVDKKLRVDPDVDNFEKISSKIKEAIQHEFITKIGRPELLGRMGGEQSIIVFDFIRLHKEIINKYISNLNKQLNNRGLNLVLEDSVIDEIVNRGKEESNKLGARGLGNVFESFLTDPIALWVSDNSVQNGTLQVKLDANSELDISFANI